MRRPPVRDPQIAIDPHRTRTRWHGSGDAASPLARPAAAGPPPSLAASPVLPRHMQVSDLHRTHRVNTAARVAYDLRGPCRHRTPARDGGRPAVQGSSPRAARSRCCAR